MYMTTYNGFSTLQFNNKKSFILNDVELIKQDLLNNIYTRKGERVKMYDYGTRIPDLIYDPLDEASIYIVSDDLTTVFNNDPRVSLNDMKVIPLYDQNAIMVYVDLYFIYLNFNSSMDIKINFASN